MSRVLRPPGLPPASGRESKLTPNARLNSLGSSEANSSLPVMMRISLGVKLLQ